MKLMKMSAASMAKCQLMAAQSMAALNESNMYGLNIWRQ
jgi:hypothetical protein